MRIGKISAVYIAICVCAIDVVYAQSGRAERFFSTYAYAQAIPLYEKKAEKNTESLEKLATCYRLTNNYILAEKTYAKLVANPGINPINHLYYGEVLLNNGKPEEAKEQFTRYSQKVTSDKRAEVFLRSCILSKLWVNLPPKYSVSNALELNTPYADFCPVAYGKGVVFVSERRHDLVNGTAFGWTNQPYLSVFFSEMKKKKDKMIFDDPQNFSRTVNTDFHNGPVTFNAQQNEMYFTRVDNQTAVFRKNAVNRPKVYAAKLIGRKWKEITPFYLNSDSFSVAHPALAPDGQILFFCSDMPGGYGGKDIYVCKREGEKWGVPENLGPQVNSVGDEMFPYIHRDGTLYFSSTGHAGLGGLDIYSAKYIGGKWSNLANLQLPINSSTDDFGIMFNADGVSGYFSSNRVGGKGGDDIYEFRLNKPAVNIASLSGKIMLNELDPAARVVVRLMDAHGNILQQTSTDSAGFFVFKNLNPDVNYAVMLDANDTRLNIRDNSKVYGRLNYNDTIPAANVRLVIEGTNNTLVKEMMTNDKGYFRFYSLPSDINMLSMMGDSNTSLALKRTGIIGKVIVEGDGSSKPAPGVEIILTDKEGKPFMRAVSDSLGFFRFENLPSDQHFMMLIDENNTTLAGSKKHIVIGKLLINGQPDDPEANVVITLGGKTGAVLKSLATDKDGFFHFENLASDFNRLSLLDVNNTSLNVNIKEGMMVENIYYDLGKWDIRSEAALQLDKVTSILKQNPGVQIELSSHTDSRAGDSFNMILSEKRARAAVDYIVSKGGDVSRISGKGYGETRLVNRCANGVKCSEEEHRQNRRTEIRVIRK